ncbi:uncharacterized protein LOC122266626 [Penaeus japonicus]|uniref:uncharacterized protein LOC122266626 n=1 Tax=Penaeus japonicus TaxID=27405 RepID=UPI001C711547|nr:uncharacterized protein LOC122266626 [Penaeus japonicus]
MTIHSFGDQMFGYIVTNGDPNVVPDIQAIQTREKYCCGGVFYGAFREPLIVTSPNYPGNYAAHMRCPYVFRCNVDYPDCVIRLEFESFDLASDVTRRNRRQAQPETGSGNTTVAPYVPPTGSDFNRTICNGEDVVRVSQCDSISAVNARHFCASNPPSQVYTGYREVILYFNSQEQKQNQGFVIKFTPRNRRKWIYSDAELDPKCPCANNLPNQIRKFFRKRNKKNKNKTKARNGPLKRVKREEKEKLKERRKGEKKDRSPGVKKRKTEKGGDKKEKKNRNNRRNNKEDAKEPKRKNKNMKKRVKGGNRGMSGKVEGKGKRREKKIEKVKRKGKLLGKMEKRLSKRKKTENKVDTDDRVFNGKTNRKRQQYPWLVSVTQYERPLLEGKSPSQRPIERMCGGTLLNDRFVLTTTSCCTYCGPIWAQKNKNNSRKKRDAEGAGKKQQDRRKKRKDREGRKNKKAGRKGNDRKTEKKNTRQKKRGRKNKNGKGKKNQKDQKTKKDQRKGKGDRKNVDETEEEEEEEEEDNNKNKNKEMKASSRRKGTKRRRPLKKDVGAVIGEGAISIKKVTPLKIADILIPRECYDKMSKKELKGQPLYPVQCPVLLKLETKLEYTKFIKPICLPIFDKIKINKERAASIGYGARKLSKIENSKRPVEVVDMRELKKCEKRLKMKLDKTMMCTKGTKKTAHMCLYDEGAPLLNVKITGSGYQQHANIYGALAVPGCKLKSNKGKRRKRDANESKRRGGGKRKANQEKPQSTEPRNKRRLSKQDTRKTKQDKFNPSKTNPYYIDVWIKIRSYKKWILNEVFNGQKSWACQRPKHLPTVPDIAKKFEIEDPCPY